MGTLEFDNRNTMNIYSQALNCVRVIKEYSWLLDSFILDFYTNDHWCRMPPSWQSALSDLSPQELGCWISQPDTPSKRIWPLSLLALRTVVRINMLPRELSESKMCITLEAPVYSHDCHRPRQYLKNIFYKQVKPKKRHEIEKMASVCVNAFRDSGSSYIIDVGSGKGHLSRVLAYGYGLPVCCLEAQEVLSSVAQKLDLQLEYTLIKHIGREQIKKLPRPVHYSILVDETLDAQQFENILRKILGVPSNDQFSFGLVGLHPCGNLAATLLRLFSNCPNAKFISIVGCCYMKLTLSGMTESLQGYPLSHFYQSVMGDLALQSYEALEISCHAIEEYCNRLQRSDYSELKIHSYRAALENIITRFWPNMKHLGLRGIKNAHNMSFSEYAILALSRKNLEICPSEFSSKEVLSSLDQWEHVVIFYTLRLLVAPLVETVVLLDRLIFLREKGICSTIVSGFDPEISPRNHILIGYKE